MGLFDDTDGFEEVEDIFAQEIQYETKNVYLEDAEKALQLIGRIISKEHYDAVGRKVIDHIDTLMDIDLLASLKKIPLENKARLQMKLSGLSDKMTEEKKYQLIKNKAVVGIGGKFSAGKSKFINSLLKTETELLPEDQNPTTSIPSYIVYGKEETISAYTMDNESVVLDVEAMQALTHKFFETYKMGFASFIHSLVLAEPDMPYRELVFLDTPGYSKADTFTDSKTHQELTDASKASQQLKSVDYLIWLVDIDNGGISQTDLKFIQNLNLDTPILFVLNKADKKSDGEIEKIVDGTRQTIQASGISCFGVTAYSSMDAEEWRAVGLIDSFLESAEKNRKSKDDILQQIQQIEQDISQEIEQSLQNKSSERIVLSDVIWKSNNIKEIRTLVDLYGECMEQVRDLREGKLEYARKMRSLERELNKHFEGRR